MGLTLFLPIFQQTFSVYLLQKALLLLYLYLLVLAGAVVLLRLALYLYLLVLVGAVVLLLLALLPSLLNSSIAKVGSSSLATVTCFCPRPRTLPWDVQSQLFFGKGHVLWKNRLTFVCI